ncbi:MAG: 50S ribosomal protein L22 [Candidatus Nealsonbacteria bacterium]|nr:MAG: 50S ribosomal protein L22 [Candidatus Nealsonbacteria bacterium]
MEVTVKLKHLRIAPRKVRLVSDLIRRKSAEEAQVILKFALKRAAPHILKLLNSAMASAKQKNLDPSRLYISKITVDEGPKFKRWRARARGQAYEIQKKTSHVTLVLTEIKRPSSRKTIRRKAAMRRT